MVIGMRGHWLASGRPCSQSIPCSWLQLYHLCYRKVNLSPLVHKGTFALGIGALDR